MKTDSVLGGLLDQQLLMSQYGDMFLRERSRDWLEGEMTNENLRTLGIRRQGGRKP
jgi:hypothetical protein